MNITVITYIAYLTLSVGLTIWVTRTLFTNGRLFLVDVFQGNTALADSVNHLLVVGFYLLNLGFVSLWLRIGGELIGVQGAIEALSTKIGMVLLVLGAIHFANLYMFSRLRRRSQLPFAPPPLAPDSRTSVQGG